MQRQPDNHISVSANDKTIHGNIPLDEKNRSLQQLQETNRNSAPQVGSEKDTGRWKQTISGDLIHIRDVNSREIFKNNVLVSQFLRDYSGLSIFSDIRPEDIEDETSKFRLQLGIELEGDTVKKIRVRIGNRQEEVYVMSLIMMINKIQGEESYHEFLEIARDYIEDIYDSTTGDIQKLILDVIWGLLMKVKVTEEEATDLLNDIREGKDMGILFENFQTFDWRGKNEELAKEKIRADQAEARADQAEARADQAEARADQAEKRVKELEKELHRIEEQIKKQS